MSTLPQNTPLSNLSCQPYPKIFRYLICHVNPMEFSELICFPRQNKKGFLRLFQNNGKS